MTETAERRQKRLKFARDIGVNVVANLIAAAIIYLLGVLVGLLPHQPAAIAAAVAVLLLAMLVALAPLAIVFEGRRVGLLTMNGCFFTAAALFALVPVRSHAPLADIVVYWTFAGLAAVPGSVMAIQWWTTRPGKDS